VIAKYRDRALRGIGGSGVQPHHDELPPRQAIAEA